MQKGFENREVRQAHVERLDATRRVTRQSAMRFHEHEPGVYGRRVGAPLRHGCEPRIAGPSGLRWYLTTSISISYNLMSSDIKPRDPYRECEGMTWRLDCCSFDWCLED